MEAPIRKCTAMTPISSECSRSDALKLFRSEVGRLAGRLESIVRSRDCDIFDAAGSSPGRNCVRCAEHTSDRAARARLFSRLGGFASARKMLQKAPCQGGLTGLGVVQAA